MHRDKYDFNRIGDLRKQYDHYQKRYERTRDYHDHMRVRMTKEEIDELLDMFLRTTTRDVPKPTPSPPPPPPLTFEERKAKEAQDILLRMVARAKQELQAIENKMCLSETNVPFIYLTARPVKDSTGTLYFILNTTSPTLDEHKTTTGIKVPMTGNAIEHRSLRAIERVKSARERWLTFMGNICLATQ